MGVLYLPEATTRVAEWLIDHCMDPALLECGIFVGNFSIRSLVSFQSNAGNRGGITLTPGVKFESR